MNALTDIPAAATHRLLADLRDALVRRLGDDLHQRRIARVVMGLFFIGVKLDNGAGGLCATPLKSLPAAVCCPSSALAQPLPGKIKGRLAAELLDDLFGKQDLRRALSIATLNALTETLWQRDGAPAEAPISSGDCFDALRITAQDRVLLVGAFAPYMRQLRKQAVDWRVMELDTATLKPAEMPHYVHPDSAAQHLAWASAALMTGTTLINGTLDGLLAQTPPHVRVAIVGPTTPLLAEPFAQRGVTLIGGARVQQADALLDMLAEGGSGYHFFERSVQRLNLHINAVRPGIANHSGLSTPTLDEHAH